MEEVALSVDSSESDGRKHTRHQWPTTLGHGRHKVAVRRRWPGWSGQRTDKRVVPLLLAFTRLASLSLPLVTAKPSAIAVVSFGELTCIPHSSISKLP